MKGIPAIPGVNIGTKGIPGMPGVNIGMKDIPGMPAIGIIIIPGAIENNLVSKDQERVLRVNVVRVIAEVTGVLSGRGGIPGAVAR